MPEIIHPTYLKDLVSVDPATAVEEVDKRYAEYYEKEILKQVEVAKSDVAEHYNLLSGFYDNAGIGFTILCIALVVIAVLWLLSWPIRYDAAANNDQMRACQTGNTIGCIEAVQEQTSHSLTDRVDLLKQAYLLKTGKPIVMPGTVQVDSTDHRYNGFTVTKIDSGLEISKGTFTFDLKDKGK